MNSKKFWLFLASVAFLSFYGYVYVNLTNSEGETNTGGAIASVMGWGYNTTRDTSQYIISNNLTAHILPEHFCDYETFLLVMVCSSPANVEARNAIRETWGHERYFINNRNNVSLYFLIGETTNNSLQYGLIKESEMFGDIIQERFLDSYNNLTLKSIEMLKLVTTHCTHSVKYLFKLDDDMFVNMRLVVNTLSDTNKSENFLMGRLICGAKPIRDPTNKWYCPYYMHPGKGYPNYLSGTGYVMSVDVAAKLYKTALGTPILHLEDVYLTGICAKKARIKPINNSKFTYQTLLNKESCVITELLTAHRFNPYEIRTTFAKIKDGNITRDCAIQRNMFNAPRWFVNNIMRTNKTYLKRKSKCE